MAYFTALPHHRDPLTEAELEDADLMLFGDPTLGAFEDVDYMHPNLDPLEAHDRPWAPSNTFRH